MADHFKRTRLSPEARKRLKWMDYYRQCQNVSQTCRHFDISRKTFYYWLKRYDPHNLVSLEGGDGILLMNLSLPNTLKEPVSI